jgi:co-chaperonin GroES (HSP10)
MLVPVGHRILVEQEQFDETDEVFKSAKAIGLILAKDPNTRYQESVDVGVIRAIGKDAWKDLGQDWAAVGDKIYFAKHAGKKVEDPDNKDKLYVILNDDDVCAIIRETV